jgi:LmbE family N-acetylglucosaminyl deacetylase
MVPADLLMRAALLVTSSPMIMRTAYRWKKRAAGVVDWDAATLDPRELGRHVVVLSPHLDDAVFSLGATMSRLGRAGAEVTALTVFGGDPESLEPAGPWDRWTGFRTAAEAAATRRVEDRKACSLLGATPIWHSFADVQYDDGSDDSDLVRALEESLPRADTLLVPGFPLTHPDHARLAPTVLRSGVFPGTVALYAELPYALWEDSPTVPEPLRELVPDGVTWRGVDAGLRDLVRKVLACRAYGSQVPCFPDRVVWLMSRYEMGSNDVIASLD